MNNSSNNSTTPIIKSSPTYRIEFVIFYITMSASSIGILLNLLYTLVFADKRMHESIYKYMLANSLGGLFLCTSSCWANILIGVILQIFNLKINAYISNLFLLYGFVYGSKAINTMISLNDVYLSIDRFFIFSRPATNSSIISRHAYFFILLNLLISLVVFLPLAMNYTVTKTTSNSQALSIVQTDFGNSQLGHSLVLGCTVGQQIVIMLTMSTISIFLVFKFRKYIAKKTNLLNLSNSNGNTADIPLQPIGTLPLSLNPNWLANARRARRIERVKRRHIIMVIYMILANLVSNLPISLYYLFLYIIPSIGSDVTLFYILGASLRFWFVLPSLLNVIIYFSLNKKFRRVLKSKLIQLNFVRNISR